MSHARQNVKPYKRAEHSAKGSEEDNQINSWGKHQGCDSFLLGLQGWV